MVADQLEGSYDCSTSQATGGCGCTVVVCGLCNSAWGRRLNAVEIEEAVSELMRADYDAAEFPYAFLEAFGNKTATIKRLRSTGKNTTNKSDVNVADSVTVLQRNNIHVAALPHCIGRETDLVGDTMRRLVDSPATSKHKAKFVLVTDGRVVHAEKLGSDEPPLVCEYEQLDDHFGYFLELAGISTVRQIRENAFDIKATGRLNRLYVELLKHNPDWDGDQRREELNHFFARLIFCFFAEDTGIFRGDDLFTETVRQMSEPSGENTHFVVSEIFRAMDVHGDKRADAKLRSWAEAFPYVNGGLFGGGTSEENVPKFTQIARSYLLHIGSLDWTKINPDIFGSMIQAVADDEERGALGMHYTSVPNIRKVLDPLFLDDLNAKLEEAGDNARKLLNLRKRIARIRVFDPACGSGNFLVIAYKEMRRIEAEINKRRGESDRLTDIPLTNFRGIEIRHFAAEIARLALVIAEYQCDELYLGPRAALLHFLPLEKQNWITHGNALRLDWLKVCPPTGTDVTKLTEDDLFQTPLDQTEIDFENEGGETYICGNPPYKGGTEQDKTQKSDMSHVFGSISNSWKSLDYVCGWFMKFANYSCQANAICAFVCTNSISQGEQVARLWPLIFSKGLRIAFAHTSFKWANLASYNAGVTVVIIGLSNDDGTAVIYAGGHMREASRREVQNIGPYLVPHGNMVVVASTNCISAISSMTIGNKPVDGGNLILDRQEKCGLVDQYATATKFVRRFVGSRDAINGTSRYCLWIDDSVREESQAIPAIATRLEAVERSRSESSKKLTREGASTPHAFQQRRQAGDETVIVVPIHSSVSRQYLPVAYQPPGTIITNAAFGLLDAELWNMSLVASTLHLVWIGTVCGKIKTDYRYSNTLGWNTFPVPTLTDQNKADLTRCAEDILLAREAHWPATIAELYDPDKMPDDLRAAHDRNDETLERIYIGRRFKNDTERLETLFQMYTEMTAKEKQT